MNNFITALSNYWRKQFAKIFLFRISDHVGIKYLITVFIFLVSLKSYSRENPQRGKYVLIIKIQTIDGVPIKNKRLYIRIIFMKQIV